MQAMGFRAGEALGPRSRPQPQWGAESQTQAQAQPQPNVQHSAGSEAAPLGGVAGTQDNDGNDDGSGDGDRHGNGPLRAPVGGNADANADAYADVDVDAAADAEADAARRTEPLALHVKEDRGGIGLDAERKRKLRDEFAHESKRQCADEGEYRERVRAEREEQRLERLVLGAMKVAERLDADTDEDADADAGADTDMGTDVGTVAGGAGAETWTQKARTAASPAETVTLGRAGSRADSTADMNRRPLADGGARSGGDDGDDGEAAGEGVADGGNVAELGSSADTVSAAVGPIVITATAAVDGDGNSGGAEQRPPARRDAVAATAATAATPKPKAKSKAQLSPPLKSINVLWRGLVRHRVEKERERRMRYDLQQSLSRLPTYTDMHETADDQRALERAAQGAEEELEEEDPELDAFSARPPAERLQLLVDYLRCRHRYCFWCKYKYPDDRFEGCPGVTEEDHD